MQNLGLEITFDEIHSKQLKIKTREWILKSQENNARLLPNACDFKKKTIPQGMDLRIYRKSIA
jgi:hypothetical protein